MTNPYTGLRPFTEADHEFFRGRDEEIEILLHRLAERRFLGVLGVSGCGKSSLVQAGLFPLLRSGLADPLGGDWTILRMVPGDGPWAALEQAAGVALPRRSHALRDWAHAHGGQFLLLVDQFEEIFDFRRRSLATDGGNEAALFVDAILAAAPAMHILFTMRTDFLGECALFRGLAEALNDGHYLVPRMTRLQLQDAIEQPALALQRPPQPELVQRLLTDAEHDPGKLPVLQHILKRLWERGKLDLSTYRRIGAWKYALRRDGECVLRQFPKERTAVERLFQWITERGPAGQAIRRRQAVSTLPAVTGLTPERIDTILQAFASRDFLRLENGYVDLMHESVMWHWPRLNQWIRDEAADAARLTFYLEAAQKKLPLTGATLKEAVSLRPRIDTWGDRYLGPEERRRTLAWIAASEKREKSFRRRLIYAFTAAVLAVILIAGFAWQASRNQTVAEQRLADTYWEQSRDAQKNSQLLPALHFAAGAIALSPGLKENLLLDTLAIVPGAELGLVLEHQGPVLGAQFTSDETRILTWSSDNTARLWDARTRKELLSLPHRWHVEGAQFTRDESRILTWSFDSTARLWDARTGRELVPPLQHQGPVVGARFTDDESRLLTWSGDNTARLWDARTGKELLPPLLHQSSVLGARFTRDETRILTWSFDHTARLWDVRKGKELPPPLQHKGSIRGAQFPPGESLILTWSDDTARLWDARSGKELLPPFEHQGPVEGAQFTHDETRILTWSSGQLRRWDARTRKELLPPLQHEGRVRGAESTRDGTRILIWSDDDTVRLWDAQTGEELLRLPHKGDVDGAQFTPDETRILTRSGNAARLWDARTGKELLSPLQHLENVFGDQASVYGAQFTRDGTLFLTWSSDHTAHLWDARTGKELFRPLQHNGDVYGARFSRDETRILTWSDDNTARLWDAKTGKELRPALEHKSRVRGAQFSRDETRILTWSDDNTARLWDAKTGKELLPPLQHKGDVYGARFTHNETRILTWSWDNTARLWDARTGKELLPRLVHADSVGGAQITRDESRIFTVSGNQAQIWRLDADLDFPAEHVPLWIQAVTGTEYDFVTRQVKAIEPERWRPLQQRYQRIASQHASVCQYPDANHWLRFHPRKSP